MKNAEAAKMASATTATNIHIDHQPNIDVRKIKDNEDNKTALAYDERCALHRCMGSDHPERPERILRIFEKLREDGLVDRCVRLDTRVATFEELTLVHDGNYVKEVAESKDMGIDDLRLWQDKWNSIYACSDTYDAALLACGNVLACVDAVVDGRALNAFALVRPPGHHAESDLAYGFCFFNNVAVAAQYARKMLGVGKVLIVDWDVHHGNGVQNAFYNDPDVLYISLHRYDSGRFFPVNERNNYTDVGEGDGLGFNINVPWNGRGMGDAEFLEAFRKIVMPVAKEFNPELVFVSAGFDAARGDPLGGYCISPHGYAEMTRMISDGSLAQGRVILALEGGYNLTSISESAAACVRVLLGEAPVEADEPIKPISKQAVETLTKVVDVLSEFWSSLRPPPSVDVDVEIEKAVHSADDTVDAIEKLVGAVQEQLRIDINVAENRPTVNSFILTTGLVFEEKVSAEHYCPWDPNHIECPDRLTRVLNKIADRGLVERCGLLIAPRRADAAEICYYHDMDLIEKLSETAGCDDDAKLQLFSSQYDDVYVNKRSYEAALISAGSTIDAVKAILDGRCTNAAAFVRPPGHHAMKAEINGFCIFNNVVIAAKIALDAYKLKRILIVDWDVHHGQGTQRAFYDDPRVLYFSIHRYENGRFWPNQRESNWDHIGAGAGTGYNVNVPLNKVGMGDAEYVSIFTHVLLPLAAEFDPELVIVSAGYDAAIGCPEGCMRVSPLCYGHLTRMLMSLANGRVCVVLEGGYCLDSLSEGAAMTLRALLGDYCPKLPPPNSTTTAAMRGPIDPSVVEVLLNLACALCEKWPSMKALMTAVNSICGKLERLPYKPKDPVFEGPLARGGPSTQKFEPRPIETVEHYRNVVDSMMAECSLREIEYKVSVSVEKDAGNLADVLEEKLKEANLSAGNSVQFLGSRVEEDVRAVMGPVQYEKLKARYADAGHNEMHAFGLMLNSLDGIIKKRTSQSAFLFLNDKQEFVDPLLVELIRFARSGFGLKRVLVVDFHSECRGTISDAFYDDNSVLTISMHRKDQWARTTYSQPDNVGRGSGAGFNMNLIWNGKKGSDSEDMFALNHIILPVAYSFDPDLVIISVSDEAAVSAAAPDDSTTISSAMSSSFYAYFISQMQTLAEGKLFLITKGMLNASGLSSVAYDCVKSILSNAAILPPRKLNLQTNSPSIDAILSYMETVFFLRPYWPYLQSLLSPNPNLGRPQSQPTPSASGGGGSAEDAASNIAEFLQLQHQSAVDNLHAIVPFDNCPHLEAISTDTGDVQPDLMNAPCESCGNVGENWICLTCWKIFCSRYVNEHAQLHSTQSTHPIALSMADLSTWCYLCDSYIRSPRLTPAKRLLHVAKFGVDLPS